MGSVMTEKMQEGAKKAEEFLSTQKMDFLDVKPSNLPEKPGVYAVFNRDTGETLYVGRTKNIRQRLYKQHLKLRTAADDKLPE